MAKNEADGEGSNSRLRQLPAAWIESEFLAIHASGDQAAMGTHSDGLNCLPMASDRNTSVVIAVNCHTGYAIARVSPEAISEATTAFFLNDIG